MFYPELLGCWLNGKMLFPRAKSQEPLAISNFLISFLKDCTTMNLNGIKITWLGHSTFHVVTPGGKSIILDPWVTGNPSTPANKKSFDKLDYMIISHGHSDHFDDAAELAKKHNPTVIAIYELCT